MLFPGGFTFSNFLADAFTIFLFIIWLWLLITIARNLFQRSDISGWVKALWVLVLIVAPYLGAFVYIIVSGRGLAERRSEQSRAAREELRRVVGFSVADEIEKLDRLKGSGSITSDEFTRLRARLV